MAKMQPVMAVQYRVSVINFPLSNYRRVGDVVHLRVLFGLATYRRAGDVRQFDVCGFKALRWGGE